MASSALEEKINKIRQQNEEIRRRYEEVEEDKKNAAKLNALVQMVPSTDWPERKEPPEFSNPPKTKSKTTKEKHEYTPQFHPGEGKKVHSFAQGEGPPPDPKYNFLADSEREEPSGEYAKESSGNRSHHKATRGSFRKKTVGREPNQKDSKPNKGNYRDESQPGYDAWRAERNRIDEDRISRQRTAEGNWRREWDNDKVHIIDDTVKKASRPTLNDFTKKDHKDPDRRYHTNNNEHTIYNRGGGHRPPHRGSSKNFYGNYDNRSHNMYDQHRNNTVAAKTPVSPTSEERTVVATDKSLKVTLNQGNVGKGHVMSVKVNSPSIAGTGRVGPRQRTRVTYSQSDADLPPQEDETFVREKSFDDKSKGTYFNNQKFPNLKRSHSQKKKENETKYHYQKRDVKKEDTDGNSHRHHENEFRSYPSKDQQKSHATKSPKPTRGSVRITKHDSPNMYVPWKREIQECSTSDEAQPERSVEHNVDHDVSTEINETVQGTKSDEIETPGAHSENGQIGVENEIASDTSIKKESEEASLIPVSDTDNLEHVAKDDTNKDSSDDRTECLEAVANNLTEDLPEISNTSSVALVPNNDPLNEELVQNESKEVSDIVANEEQAHSTNDDKQSSEDDTKQFVNDDCDNIEGEVPVQRSTQNATENPDVSSSEDKTNSVIEINNRSVCDNESVREKKETDEIDESLGKNVESAANSGEENSENTPSQENVDEKSVENNEAKTVEAKNDKEEKGNGENDKPLQ